jgi:hypothetical protein
MHPTAEPMFGRRKLDEERRQKAIAALTPHHIAARSSGQVRPILERLRSISNRSGLPYRIVEANSIFNEGQPGASDTLGAAVWALELMFQTASADGAGINFHTGGRYRATPVYYGMLMFAIAGHGILVPVQLVPSHPELNALATRTDDETLRVCLINKHMVRSARVTINSRGRYVRVSTLKLVGPAANATTGVTLGGATVDEFGGWSPLSEIFNLEGDEFIVDLAPASATVVSISKI